MESRNSYSATEKTEAEHGNTKISISLPGGRPNVKQESEARPDLLMHSPNEAQKYFND